MLCTANKLTELDVRNCPKLTELACSSNELSELDVSACPALSILYCEQNKLSSLDVSGAPALTDLYCYKNPLTVLNADNCPKLRSISCEMGSLTELNVSDCPVLKYLFCEENSLSVLDISECPSLINLVKNVEKVDKGTYFEYDDWSRWGTLKVDKTVQLITEKISITDIILSSDTFTYTGSAIKPKVVVKYQSTVLDPSTDYTLSYKNNTNAGTATVTVTGKG
ncbi:MAG: hypothetical protein HUJ76_13285, partial [Parasporobacterium sp.]|nr:hypothetical protein [Parasporobacterium sp.]